MKYRIEFEKDNQKRSVTYTSISVALRTLCNLTLLGYKVEMKRER